MELKSDEPTTDGPSDAFTGPVWRDVIAADPSPSAVQVYLIRFSPGARTAWHSHANGQTLHVTDGRGLVRTRDGEALEVRAGDTVYTPPGEWHWHGAAPDHFMSHLSITRNLDPGQAGPNPDWGDHVSDEEYAEGPIGIEKPN